MGKRVFFKACFGTIRYFGKLQVEKAGEDNWFGIEWDEEQKGKHDGTVDGVTYFLPEYHLDSPNYPNTRSCSFIRDGKLPLGLTFKEALLDKYKTYDDMTEE